ncbi:MAG: hypothetical protein ACLFU8_03525 [Anaerolineales bacterium]
MKIPEPLRRHENLAAALLLAGLVLLTYGFTLGLPFFHDDLPIMTWVSRHGWGDVWFSQENHYYRPLAFTFYKLGTLLPLGLRQGVLHSVNLLFLWAGGLLLAKVVQLSGRERRESYLAAVLYLLYPFLSEAVPWITALSHPQVAALTLLGAYGGLKAEREGKMGYWALAFFAALTAPLAHESGAVSAFVFGGIVLFACGWRSPPRLIRVALVAGVNVAIVGARALIPGAYTATDLAGLPDLLPNAFFFLHGLLYPVAPLLQAVLVRWGWHDFTLLTTAGLLLALLLALLAQRGGWRWIAQGLWWWAVAALPAVLALRYAALFVGERTYALAAPGIALLWAGLLVEVPRRLPRRWPRKALLTILVGVLLIQNLAYLHRQRTLYLRLDALYEDVLAAVAEENGALFVNLPAALTWEERTYPLVTDDVVFVPGGYTNLGEFIEVNLGEFREVRAATAPAIFEQTDPFWLSQGPWLEGEALRDFLIQGTVWLGRHDGRGSRFWVDYVGSISESSRPSQPVIAHFEGGPSLHHARVASLPDGRLALTLEWHGVDNVDGTVFVHLRDNTGQVVAQADGAALGGLLPLELWQRYEWIRDVRYLTPPPEARAPFTIQVGVYRGTERFPAFVDGERVPDDVVVVAVVEKIPGRSVD